jgi:hypothetical protein
MMVGINARQQISNGRREAFSEKVNRFLNPKVALTKVEECKKFLFLFSVLLF